ncbi:MAG: ATP-grasp domain-containing protein [Candidatus Njordarchaeales archaeon]
MLILREFFATREEWARVKYYPYEGYDLLLGRDGYLYFLEANAVPAGIYVVSVIARIQGRFLPPYEKNLVKDVAKLVDRFVEMCLLHYYYERNEWPRTAMVTVPPHRESFLNPERIAISYALKRRGIKSWIVGKSKILARNSYAGFIDPETGNEVYPDLIIRRSFDFPKGLKQVVVNPSEVGYITGSKIRTYNVVTKLLNSNQELVKYLRIPLTWYSRSGNKILRYVEELLEMGKKAIIKPASGSGGKGIIVINSREELEAKKGEIEKEIQNGKYLLVQELVPIMPVLLSNNLHYAFDIRVYGFMGRLVSVHLRRAPAPINNGCLRYENVVSNVSAGGSPILALIDPTSKESIRVVKSRGGVLRIADKTFQLDDHVVVIGGSLLKKLEVIVLELSKAISEAV